MKTWLLTTCFLLTVLTGIHSQNSIEIRFTEESEVYLNDLKLDNTVTLSQVTDILGEPVLHKEYKTGKAMYKYPELGLAVYTVNDNLLFIGANYNWDGDNHFPETQFTGQLMVGELEITSNTSPEELQNQSWIGLACPMPGMCLSKNEAKGVYSVTGFQEGKITQIGFEFH